MTERVEIAVVGSGFAGTILARALRAAGRSVALLERGRHPRFAVGESSTPLAAIALERLAARYDLPDLHAMAAYGRWLEAMPEVHRGLKRGFTFLSHRPGEPYDPETHGRLLVAASPSDRVADAHWLRSELDARLVERAVREGVAYRDGVELDSVEEGGGDIVLRGTRDGEPFALAAGFVVDATGGAGFLAGRVEGLERGSPPESVASSLLYGHFEGMAPLAPLEPPGPYPDEAAAVHHLVEEGWIYVLPFDDRDGKHPSLGRASVGIELVPPLDEAPADPEAALRAIVARYPTLAAQLDSARAIEPIRFVPRVQHRLRITAPAPGRGGRRWLLLPHTYAFTSPLFSTGIAWSLVAVERAAELLAAGPSPNARALTAYDDLLAREADWIERLVAGAFRCLREGRPEGRFPPFAAWSLLYFVAASFAEASQRLVDRPVGEPWHREPFLAAGDPLLREVLAEAERRLPEALAGGPAAAEAFRAWLLDALEPRELCGFGDPARRGLHPVDLGTLVADAGKLGLSADAVRAALPRLRGDPTSSAGRTGSGLGDTIPG